MAGKPSHATKLATHLGRSVDAACMINKPGATATLAVAGVVGAAASAVATRRPEADEIKVVTNGWLAISPNAFALVKGDKFLGNPKGEPFAEVRYDEVSGVELRRGRITMRAQVALSDGRTFAFETKTKGPNRGNPEVLELLAERCG